MVATRDGEVGLRVHLENAVGGTLCESHTGFEIHDRNVATGWPDCEACIKKTEADKPSWLA